MRIAVIENKLKDYIINVFHQHSDSGIELAGFWEWEPQRDAYQDISVGKIEDLDHEQYDAVLIAIKENRYLSRLLTYLHNKQVQNVYVVRLFALDMQKDFLREAQPMKLDGTWVDRMPEGDEKPYLVHLETHVCDHCNLNCKACNNFSPFVKEPSYADIDQFERDLKRLAELFSGIGRFFLLGGEPLLAPKLCCDMIRCFRKYFPTNELRVLTNATLILSMKDGFWNCLRENDVIIHISLYPPVKERIDEIRQRLEEERIKYLVFREVETFVKHWTAYPFEDEEYNNEHCGSAGCHYLRNGEISKCPDAILVDFMAKGHAEISGLRSNDSVKLADKTNAWELIDKIDSPIDLCQKCAFKRLEGIRWERVEEEAQLSDWLLPHRYEAESAKLKCANEKAKSEIDNLKRENERAKSEIDKLKCENEKINGELVFLNKKSECQNQKLSVLNEEIKSKDSELEENKNRISLYKKREKVLEKELNILQHKCNDANNSLKEVQQEYERIKNSYSNKIGRLITWVPRSARRVLKKMLKCVIPISLQELYEHYHNDILIGFQHYKLYMEKYGSDALILKTSGGTGDVYMAGRYYESLVKKLPDTTIPVFTVIHHSGYMTAELFDIKNIELIDYNSRRSLIHFGIFCGFNNVRLRVIHHHPRSLYISILYYMETVNDLSSADILKYTVYNDLKPSLSPKFDSRDDSYWFSIFKELNLQVGKTVLLCPYSVSMKPIPEVFWEKLAMKLISRGFCVVTNTKDSTEHAVQGTKSINVDIKRIVPFLNKCGYLLGVRSGLIDVTESALIKRIILYGEIRTGYRGKGGHSNSMIDHFSFNKWYERQDALELEYSEQFSDELTEQILNYIGE